MMDAVSDGKHGTVNFLVDIMVPTADRNRSRRWPIHGRDREPRHHASRQSPPPPCNRCHPLEPSTTHFVLPRQHPHYLHPPQALKMVSQPTERTSLLPEPATTRRHPQPPHDRDPDPDTHDDDDMMPKPKRSWKRYAPLALVGALGIITGVGVTVGYEHRPREKPPMVPPIWKLPPVSVGGQTYRESH